MIIGIDFDNTIACYDALFHKIAVERKLIPFDVPATKEKVRDHLRRAGQEDAWTELQGHVYGPAMNEAAPFPGVIEFLTDCRQKEIRVHIISHRTRRPFLGPKHDLHQSARQWLEENGFFDAQGIGLRPDQVHLELTKEAKFQRIAETGCTHFIEDLPEFLTDPKFPKNVSRILFDPAGNAPLLADVTHVKSWKEIQNFFLKENFPDKHSLAEGVVGKLLSVAGWNGKFTAAPLPGAANNRVFQIEAENRRFLLKSYFRHPEDPRDRLITEFSFSRFAWENGVRALPEPIACDEKNNLGLYEFIAGRRLRPEEVTWDAVEQALGFYLELNRHKDTAQAHALPEASEACFSITDHINCTNQRINRLLEIGKTPGADPAADAFTRNDLSRAWDSVLESVRQETQEAGLSLDEKIPPKDRRLSPSDFGFHNALLTPERRIRFIDFEYAGWDDPAKMVCDFFCQREIPVPDAFFEKFAEAASRDSASPEALRQRISILLPVYRIKWCCILLNDFLSVGMERRRFARGDFSLEEQKEKQLEKARRFLKVLQHR